MKVKEIQFKNGKFCFIHMLNEHTTIEVSYSLDEFNALLNLMKQILISKSIYVQDNTIPFATVSSADSGNTEFTYPNVGQMLNALCERIEMLEDRISMHGSTCCSHILESTSTQQKSSVLERIRGIWRSWKRK